MVTGVKLQHHVLSDGEFHDAHRLYVGERQIHRVVMGVVAHQPDAARLVRAVHVLHGQIVIAVNVERNQVHLTINDVVQAADFLESDDVTRLEDGVHAVAADINCTVVSNCQFLQPLEACGNYNYLLAYGSPVKRYTYRIRAGIVRPGTTRRVDYHGTDSIVETVTMAYDDTRKYNAVSRRVLKSDGTQEVERYYYSNHSAPDRSMLTSAQQTAIGTLTTNNRLTTVVQQETLKGSTKLYSVLNGFDSDSQLKQQYYRKGSGTMDSRVEYRVYDTYRNPIHVVKDSTEHMVYIWGYKGKRLVAEIKGADYNTVKSALGCTPESLSSATSPNMTLIDGLRSKLTGATVTTYTHDPLLGPLTKRDANNNVTNYLYDSAGRLEQVKAYNGNLKEKYQYHFRP